MTTQFSELGLHPDVLQAVVERGYETPTPIQAGVIPIMLTGQDVIAQAQTGTGKTAAFALPILHTIDPSSRHIQTLVMAPTRELAQQVANAFHDYGHLRGVRVLAIYGGQSYERQIRRLKKGVNVVVGTPGRLLDLINRKQLDLSHVETVVLDEADEMLSMGFIEDIELILGAVPDKRQMTLFSATLPTQIRRLADAYMHNPEAVTIQRKQLTASEVMEWYVKVNEEDKLAALTRMLEIEPVTTALVFAKTRAGSAEIAVALTQRGFAAEVINGDLSQDARERTLSRFRSGQINLLIATDVAARGLDIDDISHVFNFDIPHDTESYVHRIGRTGRAGKSGVAISMITRRDMYRLRKIENYTRQKIAEMSLPTVEEIKAKRDAQAQEKLLVWLNRDRCKAERELVEQMVEEGYDPLDVAAAALKMVRAADNERPIEPIGRAQSKNKRDRNNNHDNNRRNNRNDRRQKSSNRKQSHESGMVRLHVNAGKEAGIRPNDIVGSIAYFADIPGRAIGAIQIEQDHTLVDVPEQFVKQVLAKKDDYQIRRQRIEIGVAGA